MVEAAGTMPGTRGQELLQRCRRELAQVADAVHLGEPHQEPQLPLLAAVLASESPLLLDEPPDERDHFVSHRVLPLRRQAQPGGAARRRPCHRSAWTPATDGRRSPRSPSARTRSRRAAARACGAGCETQAEAPAPRPAAGNAWRRRKRRHARWAERAPPT